MSSPRSGDSPRRDSDEPERVVIRDKRRIDPLTGEPRTPNPSEPATSEVAGGRLGADTLSADAVAAAAAQLELAERTADLQRLQAEFANYRKRVDRDRVLVGEYAAGTVLAALLPVLDDIERARSHGDLTGGLKAVADQLDTVLGKLGLVAFGGVGDAFDPAVHEAVLHDESPDVQTPTTTTVMRRGYKHGDRLLRPAMVGVTDPATPTTPEPTPTEQPSVVPERGNE